MRSEDSLKNSLVNTIGQTLTVFFQFVLRMVFIDKLGDIFVSINGLFTNILSVLSIAELGMEFAICYTMYDPLAKKDENKVNLILNSFRKIYLIIGLIIFVAGIALTPFLKYLIGDAYMLKNIYLIFFLYLIKTCVTYWLFSYRITIIQADQKRYKLQKFIYIFRLLNSIAQLIILIVFQSFIAYLVCALVFTILESLFIGYYVGKQYPYIKNKPEGTLTKGEKKELLKNISGASLYKISNIAYSSSDSIIIAASTTISFVVVGYYSNYMLIFTALTNIISKLISSTSASIGNFNITETPERKKELYNSLSFVNFWIYGVVSICCLCLINPFISIFFDKRCLLDSTVVILMLVNFLLNGLFETLLNFKDSCGLFYKGRFRPLVSVTLNIAISILLLKPLGLTGILLGTILSHLLSTFVYDPQLIYKNVFNKSVANFYIKFILQFVFITIIGAILYYFTSFVTINNIFLWIVAGIVLFLIANFIFWIFFRWTKEFKFIKSKILKFLKKFLKK